MRIFMQFMLVSLLAIWGQSAASAQDIIWTQSSMEGVETSTPEVLSQAKGKRLYVEFVNSPKLTALFADAFKKKGAIIVTTADEADMTAHIEGQYKALRPATGRRGRVDIGIQMEKAGEITTKDNRVGLWISQGMGTMTPLQTSGVVSIVDIFARASGFRDWFNSKIGGDPDGVCLAGCEAWKYVQEALVVIGLKEKGQDDYMAKAAFRSQATEKELVSGLLIDRVLNASLAYAAGNEKLLNTASQQ